MIKSIQRFLKALSHSVSSSIKQLLDGASKRLEQNKPVPAAVEAVGIRPEEPPAVPDMVPLAVEPPLIQVECISCGSIGELTAICQKCQGPVCTRSFCRKGVYNQELDMEVILCRDCEAAI